MVGRGKAVRNAGVSGPREITGSSAPNRGAVTRRCRALARHTLTLHEGMFLVGTVYNFCTPHESLSQAQQTTPAMAAGITDHGWTIQELLSFQVPLSRWSPPKQRGRPSHALKRLIGRWCRDHG
jgi:hypothetical protein